MKKILFFTLSLILLIQLFSCQEKGIEVFGDRHEVYFKKFFMNAVYPGTEEADSTNVTFFFAEEHEKYMTADLVVNLAGRKLEEDLHFSLKVVPEETTALSDEYELDPFYTFRASSFYPNSKEIVDTIRVKMCRSDRLNNYPEGVRLVVEIVPNENVFAGQFERSRAKIVLTENSVRPTWWTKEVEVYLLGTYSAKKYKVFLRNVEGAINLNESMIFNFPDKAIKLARAYKKWLSEQELSNPDIYEEDGSFITLNV